MYQWILTLHIISLISWFAMLFYMPRLFVYHAEQIEKKEFVDVVKVMEEKLYRIIGLPAMIATIATGIGLIVINPDIWSTGGWLHAKLALVAVLVGYHLYLNIIRNSLASNECEKSGKFFRILNEVPTLIMIAVVTLVIVKPF